MDSSKQYLFGFDELVADLAPSHQEHTPDALYALNSALQLRDIRTVEDSLRKPVIVSSLDHKAIALYLLVAY